MPFIEKNPLETFALYREIRDLYAARRNHHVNFVMADVRSKSDRQKANDGIPYAIKVPWDDHDNSLELGYFPCEREVKVVVYCTNGKKAAKAKDFLEANGYTDVFNAYSAGHVHSALGTKPTSVSEQVEPSLRTN